MPVDLSVDFFTYLPTYLLACHCTCLWTGCWPGCLSGVRWQQPSSLWEVGFPSTSVSEDDFTAEIFPWCFISRTLDVSDYELQVSLSEALCRLTPRKERELRAKQWFSSCDISAAFCDILDKDFEVVSDSLVSHWSACNWFSPQTLTRLICLRTVAGSSTLSTVSMATTEGGWCLFNQMKPKCQSDLLLHSFLPEFTPSPAWQHFWTPPRWNMSLPVFLADCFPALLTASSPAAVSSQRWQVGEVLDRL